MPGTSKPDRKRTVCFDFDGVIHSYEQPWQGEAIIPDAPVPGVTMVIKELRDKGYKVVVMSTRTATEEGRHAVEDWLDRWGIVVDGVVSTKPAAIAYVDDRAVNFDGDWGYVLDDIEDLQNRPSTHEMWRKKHEQSAPILAKEEC